MADVGVLELTIHDDAKSAASGLNELVGALQKVKAAVPIKELSSLSEVVNTVKTSMKGTGTVILSIQNLASAIGDLKAKSKGLRLTNIEKIGHLVDSLK